MKNPTPGSEPHIFVDYEEVGMMGIPHYDVLVVWDELICIDERGIVRDRTQTAIVRDAIMLYAADMLMPYKSYKDFTCIVTVQSESDALKDRNILFEDMPAAAAPAPPADPEETCLRVYLVETFFGTVAPNGGRWRDMLHTYNVAEIFASFSENVSLEPPMTKDEFIGAAVQAKGLVLQRLASDPNGDNVHFAYENIREARIRLVGLWIDTWLGRLDSDLHQLFDFFTIWHQAAKNPLPEGTLRPNVSFDVNSFFEAIRAYGEVDLATGRFYQRKWKHGTPPPPVRVLPAVDDDLDLRPRGAGQRGRDGQNRNARSGPAGLAVPVPREADEQAERDFERDVRGRASPEDDGANQHCERAAADPVPETLAFGGGDPFLVDRFGGEIGERGLCGHCVRSLSRRLTRGA